MRLDPCPSEFRSVSLAVVNDNGVGHQRGRLVPFDADRVLVCRYHGGNLNGFVHLAAQAAEAEVDDTNLLPQRLSPRNPCPSDESTYLITFWHATQRVVLKFTCPYVTNSFRIGLATRTWANYLDFLIDDMQRAGRSSRSS